MKPRRYQWVVIFWMLFRFHASATVRYVNLNNSSPASPYTNWLTAATNIQDAINAASIATRDTILVTNGIYQYGGYWKDMLLSGTGTNRVYIPNSSTVQSVNGPSVTVIKGYQVPGTTNGNSAIRCVYMDGDTTLSGFTLTNGATQTAADGGGVFCAAFNPPLTNCVITNCIITGNAAESDGGGVASDVFHTPCRLINCTINNNTSTHYYGGGAAYCTLINCILTGNSATYASPYSGGGGGYSNVLINCTLTGNKASIGGGALGCSLTNCILNNNSAARGGGAEGGTLVSCLVISNFTSSPNAYGGGADSSTLIGCSLVGNSSLGYGGGAANSTLKNCTLIDNSASVGGGADSCSTRNCSMVGNFATNGVAGLNNGFNIYNCII